MARILRSLRGAVKPLKIMVNAADDPFLSAACYPRGQDALGRYARMKVPCHGGHVRFVQHRRDGWYWSERRAVAFLRPMVMDRG